MPNWCSNSMKIVGEPKAVVRFIKENYSNEKDRHGHSNYVLDFEKLSPTPVKEDGEVIDEWYTWRIEHWGTKWCPFEQYTKLTMKSKDDNIDDIVVKNYHESNEADFNEEFIDNLLSSGQEFKEIILESSYDTAWGPAQGMFMKWVKLYKDDLASMTCKYYEPGCCFAGEFTWNKGDEYMSDNYYDPYEKDCGEESYIKYLLDENWEHVEWYIDLCTDLVTEMNKDLSEEQLSALLQLIEDTLSKESNENCAKLIADINKKYHEFKNKENN